MKEGKARQDRAAAEAGAQDGDDVNDRAERICWFCHGDVTNLEINKCAGCRKVTLNCRSRVLRNLFFEARYCDTRCQKADWGRHGDYCIKVFYQQLSRLSKKLKQSISSRCKRRSRRRWRRRGLNRKYDNDVTQHKKY